MSLPLVPFEYYMLADDRPDYPMTMCLRAQFTGVFDRPSFERALKKAILRQPLLHAYIRQNGRRLEWVDEPNPEPLLSWDRLGVPWDFPRGRQIDLRREIGVRMSVRQDEEQSEFLLQISHVCCDGLGMMQFMEDLVLAYHIERSPDAKVEFRPIDHSRLTQRGKFGLTPMGLLRRAHLELLGLLGAVEFMSHRPLPIPAPAPPVGGDNSPASDFPAYLSHRFEADQVKVLRNAAKQEDDVTLNDILVRDLFLALGDWTEKHDPANRGRVLRVMVPVNLREEDDKHAPASNLLSMVNLDRRPTRFGSPEKLLRGLAWEMRLIRKYRLGLTLIHLVRLMRKIGVNLSAMLPTNRCLTTSVMSNVGKCPSGAAMPRKNGRCIAGEVVLEQFEGFVVLRPHTRATFLVAFYGGAMILTMHYDPKYFTADQARELFDVVLSRMNHTMAQSPASDLVHSAESP